MRIDLHCHTHYSPDALASFESLLRWMDRRGIDVVAITDHDRIDGAVDFHSRAPGRFVVGEEIKTAEGELLALFLDEEVPPGLPAAETVQWVRDQGGLVGASHPLDRMRPDAVGAETLETLAPQLDFVEVLNARVVRRSDNDRARSAAAHLGLPGTAGSDAHAAFEVGRAYVEMPPFDDPASFLVSLSLGRICGRVSSPLVHWLSIYARLGKRLGAR
jgi:predicted metal-dependent phosphoesterase TrpH